MENIRRGLLGIRGWSVEDHYAIVGSFWLDRASAEDPRGVTLAMAVGNLVIPNLAVVEVNGTPIEVMAEPERAPYSSWSHTRAREYRMDLHVPPLFLVPGENQVRVLARMLPGLVELGGIDDLSGVHNMSADQVTLVVPGRAGGGPGPPAPAPARSGGAG